eukprot:TRINITY_DN17976_c0_g1_i1.p1 TRINITY_DN17976_c0_g1~~TRINITY_DN17976_c0_g1_i1.p1  ORF type:complete len:479 (+),score=58.63 TRINITY_DN17976_c0_g1_i1:55-1491(+)
MKSLRHDERNVYRCTTASEDMSDDDIEIAADDSHQRAGKSNEAKAFLVVLQCICVTGALVWVLASSFASSPESGPLSEDHTRTSNHDGSHRPAQRLVRPWNDSFEKPMERNTEMDFGWDGVGKWSGLGRWPGKSCRMDGTTRCDFDNFQHDMWTSVFPRGRARCIFDDMYEYAFQVIPGDAEKLVFYFQSGGNCWEEAGLNYYLCTAQPLPQQFVGIFDRRNHNNPFRTWSIVHVGYCSGDEHVGDVRRAWKLPRYSGAEQRGYWNVRAALDWTLEQLKGRKLRHLVIAGSSAGSLGAQLWARTLLKEFAYQSATVLWDSFVGVLPSGVEARVLQELGTCRLALLNARDKEQCSSGTLSIDMIAEVISDFPKVAFASITSKADSVQMGMYNLFRGRGMVSIEAFWARMASILKQYDRFPNHASFVTHSSTHDFLNSRDMYQASADFMRLSTWICRLLFRDRSPEMLAQDSRSLQTQCH